MTDLERDANAPGNPINASGATSDPTPPRLEPPAGLAEATERLEQAQKNFRETIAPLTRANPPTPEPCADTCARENAGGMRYLYACENENDALIPVLEAKPSTIERVLDARDVGRTEGSNPSTGANPPTEPVAFQYRQRCAYGEWLGWCSTSESKVAWWASQPDCETRALYATPTPEGGRSTIGQDIATADVNWILQMASIGLESYRQQRIKAGHHVGTKSIGLYDEEYDRFEDTKSAIAAMIAAVPNPLIGGGRRDGSEVTHRTKHKSTRNI